MKKTLMIIVIIIIGIVTLYFGLLYHARMNVSDWGGMVNPDAVIGEDGEYYIPGENIPDETSAGENNVEDINADEHMLDGDFTYVDNEKLLERIVGEWNSEDGAYTMTYDSDYQMAIMEEGVEVFSTRADFTYLQPGEVICTDFMLEEIIIKDKHGNNLGEVDYCYHVIEDGEDWIYLSIILLNVDNEEYGNRIIKFHITV